MLWQLLLSPFNHGVWLFIFKFIPYVLFFELPVYILIFFGMMRYVTPRAWSPPGATALPPVRDLHHHRLLRGRVGRTHHPLTRRADLPRVDRSCAWWTAPPGTGRPRGRPAHGGLRQASRGVR